MDQMIKAPRKYSFIHSSVQYIFNKLLLQYEWDTKLNKANEGLAHGVHLRDRIDGS